MHFFIKKKNWGVRSDVKVQNKARLKANWTKNFQYFFSLQQLPSMRTMKQTTFDKFHTTRQRVERNTMIHI